MLSNIALRRFLASPAPAFAAGTDYTAGVTANATTTFDKYLVMDSDANVPNVIFNYTIAPGTTQNYDVNGQKFQVNAGGSNGSSGTPSIQADQAAFTTADTKLNAVASGDYVNLASGQSYVKKPVTINFSSVSFSEPGIYRWVITEQETAGAMGTAYDTQKGDNATAMKRILDVYVVDNGSGLDVAQYVIHESDAQVVSGANLGSADVSDDDVRLSDKSDGYVNEYSTYDLTFSKAVSGNQASKDKVFAFTVKIEGAVVGTKYDVDISGAQATSASNAATIEANAGKANVTQLTVGADGSIEQVFYLTHGQNIKIKGLASGTKYTITENAEDYKPAIAVTGDTKDAADDDIASLNAASVSDASIEADTTVAFTNTRNGMVPTGVVLSAASGLALIGIGGGAILFASRKRKEDEE